MRVEPYVAQGIQQTIHESMGFICMVNECKAELSNLKYRTRAIITRGLYTFYPFLKAKNVFYGAFFVKF